MATTANPRVSKARRTLRTACGLHPTAWAITGAVSPRAEAKSMWQRRTVNPSDERRPACKAWRSGPLNSRTKRGFIPQHMTQARNPNNVRWNCTSDVVRGGEEVMNIALAFVKTRHVHLDRVGRHALSIQGEVFRGGGPIASLLVAASLILLGLLLSGPNPRLGLLLLPAPLDLFGLNCLG